MERICYHGIRECADAMGISVHTLKNLCKRDSSFPVIKTGPRNSLCLYPVDQIKAWMAAQAEKKTGLLNNNDSEESTT